MSPTSSRRSAFCLPWLPQSSPTWGIGLMKSRCEGQIVPYPILKTVLSRWFRSCGSDIWTIEDIEDLWTQSSFTYAIALERSNTDLSADTPPLVSFIFGLSIDSCELGLFLFLPGFSMIQEVLKLCMGFQEQPTFYASPECTLPVIPRPSSILFLASAFSFSTLSLKSSSCFLRSSSSPSRASLI